MNGQQPTLHRVPYPTNGEYGTSHDTFDVERKIQVFIRQNRLLLAAEMIGGLTATIDQDRDCLLGTAWPLLRSGMLVKTYGRTISGQLSESICF